MHIDAPNRQVTLSVGEFAAFTTYATPGFGGVSAIWRAQLGTEWHQRIQSESDEAGEGMRNEVTIAGPLVWRNWTLNLSGRIDQLKTTDRTHHLREIKTLSEPVPLDQETIRERYPSYPLQLLTYRELLIRNEVDDLGPKPETRNSKPGTYRLELLFVEIGSGLTQSLTLDPSYDSIFVDHLDTLVDYLEAKQERLARLRSLAVRPAYDIPRPGQENIQAELTDAFSNSKITLLEAPTGYGKTGVAWEYAARRLAAGQCDRVLYLTSKSTGQTEALTRLKALLSKTTSSQNPEPKTQNPSSPLPATFWHIRNKQEHCIHHEFRCSRQTCPYLANLHDKWKRSGLQRLYLLSQDELDLETLRTEGRVTGICPYEIMRAGLGQRDIWIGDYNYLFSPTSARLLADQTDFDPARTFLIIDEAHNLPSRVESSYTYEFSVHPVYAALDDLNANKAPAPLRSQFKTLASLLTTGGTGSTRSAPREPKATPVDPASEADFRHALGKISELLTSEPLAYEELQPETLEQLFQISSAHAGQQRAELRHLLWSPSPGALRLECIDAAQLIQSQLSQYNGALFLSATLTPLDSYLDEVGLTNKTLEPRAQPPISHLTPPAPWRNEAYDVAIDLRVDTRFKSRSSHLPTTASTIAAAAESAGPAIAFFPSYAYAKQAQEALQFHHPELRVALQPRSGGSLADRNAYLEETLAFHDVLILILGSSYAEGVDTLGGKAGTAIIVSPALPEMNFIQEAKRRHHDDLGNSGFERAYLHPGIQKVNQALGRLVRSPEHKVKALLHCQRFADPKTKRLLDPLYQSRTYIHEAQDLREWLES
ncbi:helicase C-terminal domain-containing protein [Pelagicoccus sp. SDUM812002]|uniref:ATP-dependent DNA helicase n=1 Tax=Pelagicoccus sp. SDUM812002 TaxID=3041266 RepID=UPI00280C703C|nr:helicase C-terminal domain-containing protein [Pelagicoccus sp. SDUM812002]MDQ8185989.1 helicase C-terminal domain-containing protein [Pelagicoccus sp. SDUM812002]